MEEGRTRGERGQRKGKEADEGKGKNNRTAPPSSCTDSSATHMHGSVDTVLYVYSGAATLYAVRTCRIAAHTESANKT